LLYISEVQNYKQIKTLIIEIISIYLNYKIEVNITSKFEDLGFDNLDMKNLIEEIEDKLRITAHESMYYSKTIGELIEQIEKFKNESRKYRM